MNKKREPHPGVVIQGKKFTKTAAGEFVRSFINSQNLGETLTGQSHDFAMELYKMRREEKAEDHAIFKVDITDHAKLYKKDHRCFWSSADFGSTWIAFGVDKALNNDSSWKLKKKVLQAFRSEIDPQVAPLRAAGKHVDHIIPFHVLLSDFLLDRGYTVLTVQVDWHPEDKTKFIVVDRELANAWIGYHLQHAKLRVISAAENLRKGGEEDLAIYRYRLARGETYDGETSANSVSH